MGLFDKKYCDICGEKIGLLGNRKLEDGNLCKNCAAKLSPWFNERRHSTVEEIRAQLAYREENLKRVASFQTRRALGVYTKVLVDEDNGTFMVTSERDLLKANPDVIALSDVTNCRLDIRESRRELFRKGPDNKQISYNPPRYEYSYDFDVIISVNNPYFDEIRFRLNPSSVDLVSESTARSGQLLGGILQSAFDPSYSVEYRQFRQMGEEICEILNRADAAGAHSEAAARTETAAQQPAKWVCQACGAQTEGSVCEYCGTARS